MSRHIFKNENKRIEMGWDEPTKMFYAQIYDMDKEQDKDTEDTEILYCDMDDPAFQKVATPFVENSSEVMLLGLLRRFSGSQEDDRLSEILQMRSRTTTSQLSYLTQRVREIAGCGVPEKMINNLLADCKQGNVNTPYQYY